MLRLRIIIKGHGTKVLVTLPINPPASSITEGQASSSHLTPNQPAGPTASLVNKPTCPYSPSQGPTRSRLGNFLASFLRVFLLPSSPCPAHHFCSRLLKDHPPPSWGSENKLQAPSHSSQSPAHWPVPLLPSSFHRSSNHTIGLYI